MHPYTPFVLLPAAVVAALVAASQWNFSDPSRYRVPPVQQLEPPAVVSGPDSRASEIHQIRVGAFMPQLPPSAPAPAPDLVLHSVMTSSAVRLATINGEVLKEGGSVQGYVVRRIDANGVELRRGDQTRYLPMRPLHELPEATNPLASRVR